MNVVFSARARDCGAAEYVSVLQNFQALFFTSDVPQHSIQLLGSDHIHYGSEHGPRLPARNLAIAVAIVNIGHQRDCESEL